MQLTSDQTPRKPNTRSSRTTLSSRVPRMGRVVFTDHANAVHCSVRRFSRQGAMLTMSGWMGLPSEFQLYVEPDNIRAVCSVTSRKGSNIEVSFTEVEEDVRFRAG